jgi:hypothetical protein
MTYGIEILSGNGNLQISSNYSDSGFIVTDTYTSVNSITYDRSKDLIFARPASGGGNQYVGLSTTSGTGSVTRTFQDTSGNSVNMEVIKGRFASEFTASTSGYGVQIFNSDGSLVFDSQQYSAGTTNARGGFSVTDYVPAFDLNGQPSLSSPITTDGRKFANMDPTLIDNSGDGFYMQYLFRDAGSNEGIFWESYFNVTFEFGSTSSYFSNFNPILIGEGGSV